MFPGCLVVLTTGRLLSQLLRSRVVSLWVTSLQFCDESPLPGYGGKCREHGVPVVGEAMAPESASVGEPAPDIAPRQSARVSAAQDALVAVVSPTEEPEESSGDEEDVPVSLSHQVREACRRGVCRLMFVAVLASTQYMRHIGVV